MQYRITHKTAYRYSDPVSLCHSEAHLRPRDTDKQRCLLQRLDIDPIPASVTTRTDFFGNPIHYFRIEQPHTGLSVTSVSVVELQAGKETRHEHSMQTWSDAVHALASSTDPERHDVRSYYLDSPLISVSADVAAYAERFFLPGLLLRAAVHDLMDAIHSEFTYDPGFTTVTTPPSEVLRHRRGVCQDFAHFAIACLRSRGLAARYVSGYIATLPPPGSQKLVGADASHAWFSVYDPTAGWLDFDPTNNQIPMDRHITTAWGRDYADITPLKGIAFGGGVHTAQVSVDVTALDEPIMQP
jgi:transglutaminase-like putative cysteine protease